MYICKDCQKEYKHKVEYCDCGNNTFDYVEDVPQKISKQPLSMEQKGEIVSKVFLMLCILLSFVVWLIPVKSQQSEPEQKINVAPKTIANIPSIDKIWDSTPPKAEEPKQEIVVNAEPIPLNVIPDYAKPLPIRKTQQNSSVTTKTEVVKPVSQTKTQTVSKPVVKPKTTTQPKTTAQPKTTVQPQAKTQTSSAAKPVVQTTKPKTQNTTQAKSQQTKVEPKKINVEPKKVQQSLTEQPKVQPQKIIPKYNPNSPEMLQYKGSLRAAMFSKLPVASIQGSGTCSVQFSIDSTGKLVNRGFAQKSDNKSLNDAVYYMMMSVPKFSAPPSSYNGELIRMNFKFNNGAYEISIY